MRYLYPNHRTATPSNVMALFVVRRPMVPRGHNGSKRYALLQWVAKSWRQEGGATTRVKDAEGTTIDEFWQETRSRLDPKRPLWLFSHGAGSDLTLLELWERMLEQEYSLDEPAVRFAARLAESGKAERQRGFIVTADPPTIVKLWHHTGCKLIWVDLRNYFDKPIDELEAKYHGAGCEAQVRQVLSGRDNRNAKRGAEVTASCVQSLVEFVRSNRLGNLKYTASAQSLAAYRHRFSEGQIMFHDVAPVKKLERDAYHGGECECYYIGPVSGSRTKLTANSGGNNFMWDDQPEDRIYHLDVNGLYPYMMLREPLPCKLVDHVTGDFALRLLEKHGSLNCIAGVKIRTEKPQYPVIRGDQVMYCTGEFDAVLCGPELAVAYDCRDIVRVNEVAAYDCKRVFTKFVRELWAMRGRYKRGGNKVFADLAKLMAVGLYGKFAQRTPQWVDVPEMSSGLEWGYFIETDMEEDKVATYRSVAHTVQKETDRGERDDTSVAISAFVTAYGRYFMRWLRSLAPARSVYYQGVDSLICDKSAYEIYKSTGLCDEEAIGMLKVKGVHSAAYIHGVNDYELDGDRKKAGVSRPWDAATEGGWKQQYESKLDTVIGCKTGPQVYSYERLIGDRQAYTRGIVCDDGWVIPWEMV